jgi:hypothetical protein
MEALDWLNQRHGRGTLQLASSGTPATPNGWDMKQDRLTPRYTNGTDYLVFSSIACVRTAPLIPGNSLNKDSIMYGITRASWGDVPSLRTCAS